MIESAAEAESGNTLIEVLLSVAIMGVVFVAILAAFGTAYVGSDSHRQQANANTVLLSAAERVKDPAVAYANCAVPTEPTYLTAARGAAVPSGWSAASAISIATITYWNGSSFQSTCNDGNPILRMQLITLLVTSPTQRAGQFATESFSLVKRGT